MQNTASIKSHAIIMYSHHILKYEVHNYTY